MMFAIMLNLMIAYQCPGLTGLITADNLLIVGFTVPAYRHRICPH